MKWWKGIDPTTQSIMVLCFYVTCIWALLLS